MKNKQLIIILLAIVLVVLYLIFHNPSKTNYKLPVISNIKTTIDKIELTKSNNTIILENKDMKWKILPEGYLADNDAITKIITDAKGLKITDLASKNQNYRSYDLTSKKKINVKLFSKNKLVREFDIGKTAPTYSHTFIKLKNNNSVYYAKGNFKNNFDKTLDDLRDKKVMELTKGIISDIKIINNKKSFTFFKTQEVDKNKKPGTNMINTPIEVWKDKSGKKLNKSKIDALLNKISSLKATKFLDEKKKTFIKKNKPTFKITLKDNSKNYFVYIYKKNKDNNYQAITSFSDYAFELTSGDADILMKDKKQYIK